MKIAVFTDCFLPAINGVVTSVRLQLEALAELGHEVELFCPQYAQHQSEEEGVFRLSAIPFPFHKREQMTFPWPPRVMKRIWTEPYDLFHLHTPFSVGLIGLSAAAVRGIPRIFHHHTLWEEYVDYLPIPTSVTERGSILLCRTLANSCQGVVAPSARVKERFGEQGVRRPIDVIPTGIRSELFQDGTRRAEHQKDEEVLLYMGRLAHEKSLDVLVRVFARIHESRPSTRLWMVGDGPARASLENQARELGLEEACRFFGFVDRSTLKDFVASAELFLFTSLTETQGLVLLEAQAGGLPVVAVRASGVDEAVDPGVTGFLVEPGEEEEMAEKALRLLSNPELHRTFSLAAQEWSANFSLEGMGRALVCSYENAVESLRKPKK